MKKAKLDGTEEEEQEEENKGRISGVWSSKSLWDVCAVVTFNEQLL